MNIGLDFRRRKHESLGAGIFQHSGQHNCVICWMGRNGFNGEEWCMKWLWLILAIHDTGLYLWERRFLIWTSCSNGECRMSDNKTFLRSKDVAHILDCSPDDVIELARRGKIKATKEGRFWRFQEKDITAYMRKQKRENTAWEWPPTCRNCGAILVDDPKEPLEGNDRPSWLQYDGSKYFITCRQCSATNIFIMHKDPDGTPVLTVSRAIMEDEWGGL